MTELTTEKYEEAVNGAKQQKATNIISVSAGGGWNILSQHVHTIARPPTYTTQVISKLIKRESELFLSAM